MNVQRLLLHLSNAFEKIRNVNSVDIEVNLEFTPNPNTLKYGVNRRILLEGAEYYQSREEAAEYSKLAIKLYDIFDEEGGELVDSVMIGQDFVSINLKNTDNLRVINKQIIDILKEHLSSGEEICVPRSTNEVLDDDPRATRIREILADEIRPRVALDGGDITFIKLENDIVFVHMMGACAGCPSSTMTLKMGIHERLREEFPEIEDIVPVE